MKKLKEKIFRCKKLFLKLFLFFLLSSFFYLSILFFFSWFENRNYPAVIFFDVGQGDSILLRNIEGKNILIDGGPDNLVIKKLGKYLPFFSRHLDIIILSHCHDDHVVGLIEVIRRYHVDHIILGKDLATGLNQKIFLAQVEKNKIKNINEAEILFLEDLLEIDFSSTCHLSILNPQVLEVKENENNSLIAKLDCAELKFLFSGDSEAEIEDKLLKYTFDLSSDIFKAGHHGSKTSNTPDFLKAIGANYFVISSGKDNRFGHPAREVISRVLDMGMTIKRTDTQGDIVFPLNLAH